MYTEPIPSVSLPWLNLQAGGVDSDVTVDEGSKKCEIHQGQML
jgi:hypothetical protein